MFNNSSLNCYILEELSREFEIFKLPTENLLITFQVLKCSFIRFQTVGIIICRKNIKNSLERNRTREIWVHIMPTPASHIFGKSYWGKFNHFCDQSHWCLPIPHKCVNYTIRRIFPNFWWTSNFFGIRVAAMWLVAYMWLAAFLSIFSGLKIFPHERSAMWLAANISCRNATCLFEFATIKSRII